MIAGFVLLSLLLWIAPFIICLDQGYKKNRVALGWICAIFLGWMGVIIMLILEPYQPYQR